MSVRKFFDTNILLYGYDQDAGSKRIVARALMREAWEKPGSFAVNVQVLQEFYVNFVKQSGSHAEAKQIVEDISLWPVVDNTQEIFGRGLHFRERYDLSLWDAMIVATANQSGATELLTEDLNHDQIYGEVRAINPFLSPMDS